MNPTSLSVIVPVYNEQFLVAESLKRLAVLGESPLLRRIQVIVIDDASTDQTAQALARFQTSLPIGDAGKFDWRFLTQERNQGKGAAVRRGIEVADCDLAVMHDADLEYHPHDLLKMIPLFLDEDADVIYGSRFLPGQFRRVLFFRHEIGNRLLTFLCDLVCDLNLTDMETCYKMMRTELLKSVPLESSDFRIEPELTIKLAKRGARIFEVPISYSGRTYQEGKKINWKDGVLALGAILKYAASDRIYKEDEFGSAILARLSRAPRFTRWMADTVRPYVGQRVLEIGAGIGNLTVNLIPRPLYWATDINPLYLHSLRRLTQGKPYLRTQFTDVTMPETFPQEQQFDTVICLNVVEHVQDDLAALCSIHNILEAGGRAIILVPQGQWLYGTLDEVLGHCRRYSPEQLADVGKRAGFQVKEVLTFNRAGTPAWWLNGKLLRRKTFGLGQIKMLNLLTPLFRRAERWMPFPALSLIGVFEK
jgi:glycosyltransferase involved in cell wall biosynthesis